MHQHSEAILIATHVFVLSFIMDSADVSGAEKIFKGKRKPNFTGRDVELLIDFVNQQKGILFSKEMR